MYLLLQLYTCVFSRLIFSALFVVYGLELVAL